MLDYLDRPIAFHRAFVKLGIGITGALLLSQAIYWSKRTKDADRWFYKSVDEWGDETGMTRREIDTARSKLRSLGILQEKKQGVPCRLFYRIDEPNLLSLLVQTSLAENASLDATNPPRRRAPIRQTITENTQRSPKTTTETTNNTKRKSVSSPGDERTQKGNNFALPRRFKR